MQIDPDALTKRYAELQRNRAIQQAIGEGILSNAEIGEKYGLSASAVQARRRTMGLTGLRKTRRQSPIRRKAHTPQLTEAVVQALVDGHTIKEISKTIHIPHYTITQMLQDRGIEPMMISRISPPPERSRYMGPRKKPDAR